MPDYAGKGICQSIRDWRADHLAYWDRLHEAMTEEEEFLDGERYEDDHGRYNRDRRLVQIRGQEVQDTIRHVAAKATEKPRSIEARPVDDDDDPDTAEVAASLVEHELSNPFKGFEDQYEAAIISSREKRLGVVWMDWEPDYGPYGEIFYCYVDPRRVMWDEAYDPHHPLCERIIVTKRIDVEKAREMYKAPWLEPDKAAFTPGGEFKPGIPIIRSSNGEPLPAHNYKDNKVTLWCCWYKNDHTMKDKPEPGDSQELAPEDRYLACKALCGYRSPTQGELEQQGQAQELPEELPLGCPLCGGDLDRIDAKAEDRYKRAYTRGKRLVIMAPMSPGPEDQPVYDGEWPIPTARSFPGFFITSYLKPGRPVGPSDTTLMWDQQIALDNASTLAVQRMYEHRTYWELPRDGMYDYRGRRFGFREDQFNVMYRDATKASMGPLNVQIHQGSGLDPQFATVYNILKYSLTQYRGITDLGPIEDRTNNKSGVAIQAENAIGEIPVEHFNRRKNRELGKFYGVVWDYIRATYTRARLARLRIDGLDMLMQLDGDDLPNFDFTIADTPTFTGLEKARSEAFTALFSVVQQAAQLGVDPVATVEIFAEINNLPRSIVRKFQKMMSEAQQKAQDAQAAQAGMMMGGPGAVPPDALGGGNGGTSPGPPPEEDMFAQLAGLNGGGMVSPLAG